MSDSSDQEWMRHALRLAERGRGYVEPNPLVGAVVVRGGTVVGEGWHQRFGEAHAEVHALAAAGDAARGATLYVTLEPCCHHGKTPPCTEAVLAAGVTRVVAAMADPFPKVAGGGLARLRAAGIEVVVGVEEAAARRLNAPYLTLLTANRPQVHAKWAMSLDGKLAARSGDSKWISNEVSRRHAHQLRGRMDGILIGIGTALADDPLLTARPPGPRTPTRIILDSNARLPFDSRLVRTAGETPTLLVAGARARPETLDALRARGCECLIFPDANGRTDLPALLLELGRRRFTNLLVEGGASVLGSLADAGLIDEIHVYLAPRLIGGTAAPSPVGGLGIERIAAAIAFDELRAEPMAGDLYLHARRRD
jgi:diaminohydroxyphosphoribosylaminopyrimidine deaminase/5-amino-6-(5-phosphoribosylamino)uracil reductase